MKELNRDELLKVKGGVEIEGITWGHFADDSVDSIGNCYGQLEENGHRNNGVAINN